MQQQVVIFRQQPQYEKFGVGVGLPFHSHPKTLRPLSCPPCTPCPRMQPALGAFWGAYGCARHCLWLKALAHPPTPMPALASFGQRVLKHGWGFSQIEFRARHIFQSDRMRLMLIRVGCCPAPT